MIAFSSALERVLQAQKMSQAELSRLTGIGEPTISKWLKQTYRCTTDDLEKVVTNLKPKDAERLVRAYLFDLCPESHRHLFERAHGLEIREETTPYRTAFERAIEHLREKGKHDPDAKSLILYLAKTLGLEDKPKS